MSDYNIQQEGELQTLPSGAHRGSKEGKPRFDLIPTRALLRVANHYGSGGVIHGDRNWEQGITFSELFASLLRHAYQFSMGQTDEDHLAAVVFNALAIMHFQETGRYDLEDIPAGNEKNLKLVKKALTSKPPPAKVKATNNEATCGPHGTHGYRDLYKEP